MSKTLQDEMMEFFTVKTGQAGTVNGLMKLWLENETGQTGTIQDLWTLFLISQGYATGTVEDRLSRWLEDDFGYTGDLNDQLLAFFTQYEEEFALTDVDLNQIIDVDSNNITVLA